MHSFQALEIILLWIFDFSIPVAFQAPVQMCLGQCIFKSHLRDWLSNKQKSSPSCICKSLSAEEVLFISNKEVHLLEMNTESPMYAGNSLSIQEELGLVILGGPFQLGIFNDCASGLLALSCVRGPFPLQQSPAQVTDFPREKAGKQLALTWCSCTLGSRIMNTVS